MVSKKKKKKDKVRKCIKTYAKGEDDKKKEHAHIVQIENFKLKSIEVFKWKHKLAQTL